MPPGSRAQFEADHVLGSPGRAVRTDPQPAHPALLKFGRIERNVGANLDWLGNLDANTRFGAIQNLSACEVRLARSPVPPQFNERVR